MNGADRTYHSGRSREYALHTDASRRDLWNALEAAHKLVTAMACECELR